MYYERLNIMIKKIDLSKLFFAAYEKTIEAMGSGGFSNDKSTFYHC